LSFFSKFLWDLISFTSPNLCSKKEKKRSSVIPDREFLPNLIRSCPSSIIFLRVPNPGVSSFHFRLIL
jgi:hypothetical protein